MSQAVILGDIHLADKAPSSRRDTYTAEILRKLEYVCDYTNGWHDVTTPDYQHTPLILSGDVFHIKTPWRTSYRLIQQVHEILSTVRGGVLIVPGNHDLNGDRLDSLSEQPLGALCRMGNVELFIGQHELVPDFLGVPYLTEFDGGDWEAALTAWSKTLPPTEPGWVPELIVTHAPIFPKGDEPGVYAHIPAEQWATFWPGHPATYYGHIHERHGIYSAFGRWFANAGALSRGSLHESSIKRWPSFTTWDGSKFEIIALPESRVRPAEEVFLFAEQKKDKAAQSSAQEFTDALGKVELSNLTIEEVLAHIKAGMPAPNVMAVIESALEEASA